MQDYLLGNKLLTADAIEAMRSKISQQIEEAVKFAKESPFPNPEIMSKLVYAGND
jgi:TPP-dependent pyruvate/acetoin dehydrogenase alpha subunit